MAPVSQLFSTTLVGISFHISRRHRPIPLSRLLGRKKRRQVRPETLFLSVLLLPCQWGHCRKRESPCIILFFSHIIVNAVMFVLCRTQSYSLVRYSWLILRACLGECRNGQTGKSNISYMRICSITPPTAWIYAQFTAANMGLPSFLFCSSTLSY